MGHYSSTIPLLLLWIGYEIPLKWLAEITRTITSRTALFAEEVFKRIHTSNYFG
jgi:hypothetical protein